MLPEFADRLQVDFFCSRLDLSRRGCHRHQRWWSRLVGANGVFRAEKVRCATRTYLLTPQHSRTQHMHTHARTRARARSRMLLLARPLAHVLTLANSRVFAGSWGPRAVLNPIVESSLFWTSISRAADGAATSDEGRAAAAAAAGGGTAAHAAWGVRRWMGRWEGEGDGVCAPL